MYYIPVTASAHRCRKKICQPLASQKGIVRYSKTPRVSGSKTCPQFGPALAYFTVFSLAPLVLVLLAVFGLIFGGSAHAQQKLTEQFAIFD